MASKKVRPSETLANPTLVKSSFQNYLKHMHAPICRAPQMLQAEFPVNLAPSTLQSTDNQTPDPKTTRLPLHSNAGALGFEKQQRAWRPPMSPLLILPRMKHPKLHTVSGPSTGNRTTDTVQG